MENKRVVIIGGGAAGMMAAIYASDGGARVTLIEKGNACGRKLRITGKGRCNVTNDSALSELLQNIPTNPRFLYSAFSFLSSEELQAFFENEGVPLKVERGKRVFPVSDKAEDIVRCLVSACRKRGVETLFGRCERILTENGAVSGVTVDGENIPADSVILATGGLSYPRTGSDGDGFKMAKELGHSVTELKPSLVPIVSRSRICAEMQGLSLKNVSMSVIDKRNGKCVYEDFGEMMFTHFGLTGPMILSASAYLPDIGKRKYTAEIDLKPALDEKKLDARLLSDFSKYANKDFVNALSDLLPQKMIPTVIALSGIDERKKVNSVTREERTALCHLLKHFPVKLSHFRPIAEAIVTKGGVSVGEVSPKTMGSKLVNGLYFCGEVLDLDAYTGGFNLQIAFSTGFLAGESAAYMY